MFPKLPEELRGKVGVLTMIVHKVREAEVMVLHKELKKLRSEAFNRAVSWRNVGEHYAKNCGCCNGTGQYHYCVNPYCGNDDDLAKDDCVHFTPAEIESYNSIRMKFVSLLLEALEILKTGVNIETFTKDASKCPHGAN